MPKLTIDDSNIDQILADLAEPFDPKDVSFKPQTINYRDKTAQAAAYADPRAYFDRLDKIVGTTNWGYEITHIVASPYNKFVRGKKAYGDDPATPDSFQQGNKVMVVASVWIKGIGTKTSTGDKDVADENAITSAEAQAIKRAISQFGPGKYFYSLGHQPFPYDTKTKKWTVQPTLPDWAVPPTKCQDCHQKVGPTTFKRGNEDVQMSVVAVLKNAQDKYKANLCAECQKKRHTSTSAPLKVAAA